LLFQMNKLFYVILACLTLLRLLRYPSYFWRDFMSTSRGPGFFTLIAGTCVLGSQYVLIEGNLDFGDVLWSISGVFWVIIMYSLFSASITSYPKASLAEEIHGEWLLAVVSTQALSILGVLVAPYYGNSQGTALIVSAILYFLGCMLYLIIISLIFWRLVFYGVTVQSLTPSYWIAMGAAAITTLSGSFLIIRCTGWGFLGEILPVLKGFTLMFWAIATWWIPMLTILGVWRHFFKHLRFVYDPLHWSTVFTLGMYGMCTIELANIIGVPFLYVVAHGFVFIALITLLFTFIGFLRRLMRNFLMTTHHERMRDTNIH
jgi:tellurite resistance protein TehA-like permease